MSNAYPPTQSLFVDVDGTLIQNRALNPQVLAYCRAQKANGLELVLWSARGKEYAKEIAEQFGVAGHFETIISKPGYILDDRGWLWARFTQVILPQRLPKAF